LIYNTHFSEKQGIKYAFYKVCNFSEIPGIKIRRRAILHRGQTDPRSLMAEARGHVGRPRWPGQPTGQDLALPCLPAASTTAPRRDGEPEGKGEGEMVQADQRLTPGQIDSPVWSGDAGRR
jgi:hypothetical protein